MASVEPQSSGGERTLHLHLDHLGTPRQVTGTGAVEVSRHHYFPFGEETAGPSQDEVALKFTGHERDDNGGVGELDYMHARYCSPVLGRFVSADPIDSAVLANPQSWNKYGYAQGNPIKFVDPDGRAVETGWDVANVSLGLASLGANVAAGNAIGATVDALGLLYDLTATAVPGLPGFAGSLIRTRRLARSRSGVKLGSGLERQTRQELLKSKSSFERLVRDHQKKLADFKANPSAFDHKGKLEGVSDELREKLIQGRIRALEKQIAKQERELQKIFSILDERL